MKTCALFMTFLCLTGSLSANATSGLNKKCEMAATNSILTKFKSYFVQNSDGQRQIEMVECLKEVSRNNKTYFSCSVFASNGDGAGDMEFKALLTSDCGKTISAFIVSEE